MSLSARRDSERAKSARKRVNVMTLMSLMRGSASASVGLVTLLQDSNQFLGEGGDSDSGDEEGLALAVRGGEVVVVLPAGTSEKRAVEAASTVRGNTSGLNDN